MLIRETWSTVTKHSPFKPLSFNIEIMSLPYSPFYIHIYVNEVPIDQPFYSKYDMLIRCVIGAKTMVRARIEELL